MSGARTGPVLIRENNLGKPISLVTALSSTHGPKRARKRGRMSFRSGVPQFDVHVTPIRIFWQQIVSIPRQGRVIWKVACFLFWLSLRYPEFNSISVSPAKG